MADVAIAYAHEDRAQVHQIVDHLADRGLTGFWDWTIPPGQMWANIVERNILAAPTFLVLWTENSVRSDWVKEEVSIAKQAQRKILAFRDTSVSQNQISIGFRSQIAPTYSEANLDEALARAGIATKSPIKVQEWAPQPPPPPLVNSNVLISYRRKDSTAMSGRIYDKLEAAFGAGNVFIDIDAMPLGVDFRDHLRERITRCRVVLAIIGPNWLGERDDKGERRIDNPTDPVRIEIEIALREGVTVVPILIGGAQMPRTDELPASLSDLPFRHGATIDEGRDFHAHMERLIHELRRIA